MSPSIKVNIVFPTEKKSAFLINSHEEHSLEWLMSNCKRHLNDNVMHSISHLTNIQVVYHNKKGKNTAEMEYYVINDVYRDNIYY